MLTTLQLPRDVVLMLVDYLPFCSVVMLSLCCRAFREILESTLNVCAAGPSIKHLYGYDPKFGVLSFEVPPNQLVTFTAILHGYEGILSIAAKFLYKFSLYSFHAAVESGSLAMLHHLLSRKDGFRRLCIAFRHSSTFTLAILKGALPLIAPLLEAHCPVSWKAVERAIALTDSVEALLLCQRGIDSVRVLELACKYRASRLFQWGYDLRLPTPLQHQLLIRRLCKFGDLTLLLIARKEGPVAIPNDAARIAARFGNIHVLRYLLDTGKPFCSPLPHAATYGGLPVVQFLLDRGLRSRSLLYYAANGNQGEVWPAAPSAASRLIF
jgi:hypothetical protein